MPRNEVRTVALIGTQGHYGTVLDELTQMPDIRLTAFAPCDAKPDSLLAWCAQHGQTPAVHLDWQSILSDPPDCAIVCGPFELHAMMANELIRHGVHVMVEKPAAFEMHELNQLRQTCRDHPDVHLACMHFMRYDPGFYTAHRLIRDGAIGDVRLINARKSYKLGRRPAYYSQRSTYGSTLLWVASHAVDWIAWYAGSSIHQVQAFHTTADNGGNGDMESAAVCCLSFENQVLANLSVDYFRPDAAPTHGDDWVRVVGTSGVIEARRASLSLIDSTGSHEIPVDCPRKPFKDFLDQIAGHAQTLVDTASSLDVTEICIRSRDSADQFAARR